MAEWANQYTLNFPVLADLDNVGYNYAKSGAIPSETLIAPGGEIVIVDGEITEADIEAVLPN